MIVTGSIEILGRRRAIAIGDGCHWLEVGGEFRRVRLTAALSRGRRYRSDLDETSRENLLIALYGPTKPD